MVWRTCFELCMLCYKKTGDSVEERLKRKKGGGWMDGMDVYLEGWNGWMDG
jgi:hypothetical protein